MKEKIPFEDKLFFSKYKPEKKIGEGSFGKIYSATNIITNEKFALKLENKSTNQSLLEQEAYILCYLKGEGIPAIKSYGFSGDYNILVMELLGKSLENLFQERSCRFSMKTVCMLGDQIIRRLEYVHSKHILHRDIKPDNFIVGLEEKAPMVYIIDFGLSKKYRSSRTLQHIKFCNNKKLTGTARYASINALKGYEQGRRDDLEAVGYVLMYFLRGSLPWQGLKVNQKEDRYKKIYEKKKSVTPEELCIGYPKQFADFITYTRNMEYEQEPDYNYLRDLLAKIMTDNHWEYDNVFDWTKLNGNIAEKAAVNIKNLTKNAPKEEELNINNLGAFDPNCQQILQTNTNVDTMISNPSIPASGQVKKDNGINEKYTSKHNTTKPHQTPATTTQTPTNPEIDQKKNTSTKDGQCIIF